MTATFPLGAERNGDTATGALDVRLHGVTLRLETDHPPLLGHARRHLGDLTGPTSATPDLIVRCAWSEGRWDPESHPFGPAPRREVVGKRMLGSADELIWLDTRRMPGLQLRFRREPATWRFDAAYRYAPKVGKQGPVPDYEHKRYFSLMSWLVYYPILWFLQRTRGWVPLHASALATPRGGIVIGGLGGVGKTTTCVALLAREDLVLISENLVLTDGTEVHAVPEPVRLDEGGVARLAASMRALVPMPFPGGLKKKLLYQPARRAERAAPLALFLPEFAPRTGLERLDPDHAAEKLIATSRLTLELDDYAAYAAALDMHWPDAAHAARRATAARELAHRAPCFRLFIDRSSGTDPVVDAVLRGIGDTARHEARTT
jgi:hypothetical protein